MTVLALFVGAFFLAAHGFRNRGRPEAWFPAACAAVILMYVSVRAVPFAVLGVSPSLAFISAAAAACVIYSLSRFGISRPTIVGLAAAGLVFGVCFRHGISGSGLTDAALTMALPAFCAGLFCAHASIVSLYRTAISLGLALAIVVILDGSLVQARLVAVGENPIWIARVLGLAVVAYVASRQRMGFRWLLLLPAGFLIYATGSRGPMWAVVISLVFLYRHRMSSRIRLFSYLLCAAVVAVGLTQVGLAQISSLGIQRESSAATRFDLWESAFNEWAASPLVGLGRPADYYVSGSYPHNFLVELLAQGGLLATAPFLAVVAIALRQAWAQSETLAALLLATVVMCFFSGSIWVNAELWLLVGWGFSLCTRRRPESPNWALLRTSFKRDGYVEIDY